MSNYTSNKEVHSKKLSTTRLDGSTVSGTILAHLRHLSINKQYNRTRDETRHLYGQKENWSSTTVTLRGTLHKLTERQASDSRVPASSTPRTTSSITYLTKVLLHMAQAFSLDARKHGTNRANGYLYSI